MKAIRLSSIAALGLFAVPAHAVVTSMWTVETYPQFDAGDATSAFITSTGELRPGWDTKRTALEGDAIWASLKLADGSVLLGSDANGAIYRLSNDSSKKLVALPGAIAVVALAQSADGAIWAGTMPGNKVFKIGLDGKATPGPVLKDAETVWALATVGNTVYAGTGPSGKLFAIAGNTAKEVFDTDDKRITALAVTSDGAVWLCTSERSLVFRLDPKDGKARAMADFAGNEVSSLAAYRDGVVAAAKRSRTSPRDRPRPRRRSRRPRSRTRRRVNREGARRRHKPGADKDPPAVTDLGRKARRGQGALFRVAADGRPISCTR